MYRNSSSSGHHSRGAAILGKNLKSLKNNEEDVSKLGAEIEVRLHKDRIINANDLKELYKMLVSNLLSSGFLTIR
jgi:hypothetical protein